MSKLKNLYIRIDDGDTSKCELRRVISKINSIIKPSAQYNSDSLLFVEKKPVLVEGGVPQTFISLVQQYKNHEVQNGSRYESDSILIYPGVPQTFYFAVPFELKIETAQNVLVLGGNTDETANIFLSMYNSIKRFGGDCEIWGHRRSNVMKKYSQTKFGKMKMFSDLDAICTEVLHHKEKISNKVEMNKTIFIFGTEKIYNDFDMLSDDSPTPVPKSSKSVTAVKEPPTTDELMDILANCSDKAEKARIIADYNAQVEEYNNAKYGAEAQVNSNDNNYESVNYEEYDARDDMDYLFRRASDYGCHIVCFFQNASGYLAARIKNGYFKHKLAFSMSKDDALTVFGNKKANELEAGVCLYSDGVTSFTFIPHIYRGIPYGDWIVDENGKVKEKEG